MSDEIVKVPEEEKYPYNPRDRRKAMETELILLLKAGGGEGEDAVPGLPECG